MSVFFQYDIIKKKADTCLYTLHYDNITRNLVHVCTLFTMILLKNYLVHVSTIFTIILLKRHLVHICTFLKCDIVKKTDGTYLQNLLNIIIKNRAGTCLYLLQYDFFFFKKTALTCLYPLIYDIFKTASGTCLYLLHYDIVKKS